LTLNKKEAEKVMKFASWIKMVIF